MLLLYLQNFMSSFYIKCGKLTSKYSNLIVTLKNGVLSILSQKKIGHFVWAAENQHFYEAAGTSKRAKFELRQKWHKSCCSGMQLCSLYLVSFKLWCLNTIPDYQCWRIATVYTALLIIDTTATLPTFSWLSRMSDPNSSKPFASQLYFKTHYALVLFSINRLDYCSIVQTMTAYLMNMIKY